MGITALILAVVFVASSAVAYTGYQKAKAAAAAAAERARGVVYQVRASAQPRRIIYGRQRVGGLECYVGTSGLKNEFLHYILIWGEGPCQEVESILFDGVVANSGGSGTGSGKYAGFVQVKSRLGGTDNDTAIAEAVAQLPGWASTDKLLGICYSWVCLKYDEEVFSNGVPSISAIIKGRNDILDPRDDTYKYTNNVQLCFSHYLTQARVGPNVQRDTEIDEETEIESANICDEAVTLSAGGTEPRYTFDGLVYLEDEPEAIIEAFRTAMAGAAVYVSGVWRFYAGAYIVPTFEIKQDMMVGPLQLQTKTSKSDHINTVKGIHVSPHSEWQPTDFPAVSSQDYIDADGEELTEDIELVNTQSPTMCRRIASIYLERARRSRTVSLKCNVEAMRAQPGLPVLLTFPRHGFNQTPMEVLEYSLSIGDNQISINLTLRETAPAVYTAPDDLGLVIGNCSNCGFGDAPTVNQLDRSLTLGGAGEQADTLTQRIQDKLGSFVIQVGSGFQMATMDVTATVHGFSEYISSTPPRAYKRHRATGSGAVLRDGVVNNKWAYTGSGVLVTISATGSVSASGESRWVGTSGIYHYGYFADHQQAEYADYAFAGGTPLTYTETFDATHRWKTDNGGSVESYGHVYRNQPGSQVTNTLSEEDTDADARARAQAAGTWSAWGSLGGPNTAAAWHELRTTGWSATAKLAKLKGTIRSNIYGYTCRVSIPLYRYAIGTPQPSTPTSVQTFDLYLEDTPENIVVDGIVTGVAHSGTATFPEWELPCEQGFVNLAGQPTVLLL